MRTLCDLCEEMVNIINEYKELTKYFSSKLEKPELILNATELNSWLYILIKTVAKLQDLKMYALTNYNLQSTALNKTISDYISILHTLSNPKIEF